MRLRDTADREAVQWLMCWVVAQVAKAVEPGWSRGAWVCWSTGQNCIAGLQTESVCWQMGVSQEFGVREHVESSVVDTCLSAVCMQYVEEEKSWQQVCEQRGYKLR